MYTVRYAWCMHAIHSSVWVNDLEATEEFYVDTLGLDVKDRLVSTVYYEGSRNLFVGSGDGMEIQFKYDPERDEIDPKGFDHFAFSVDNIDEELERITTSTGCPVVLEPTTMDEENVRIAFLKDPDGYKIELVEEL